jgi:recombinational DNA repair protein (RecF pathway)
MYQKYHTDAIVLASWEHGEADKVYALYTKDFGMVRARASAVRRESSKMRYALQNYSLCSVSLIRGKRGWRVAGARSSKRQASQSSILELCTFGRIADLITKLVTGEERNEYLYTTIVEARNALFSAPLEKESISNIEILCVVRVLYALGYVSNEALQSTLFRHSEFTVEHLAETESRRIELLASINTALTETQLVRR